MKLSKNMRDMCRDISKYFAYLVLCLGGAAIQLLFIEDDPVLPLVFCFMMMSVLGAFGHLTEESSSFNKKGENE